MSEDTLNAVGGHPDVVGDDKLGTAEVIKRSLSKFSGQRVGPLFAERKLGLTTALLWFVWATIGNAAYQNFIRERKTGLSNSPLQVWATPSSTPSSRST